MMEYSANDISSILMALKHSAERHRNQRRKDAQSTPYINHPIEVAEVLWRVGEVREIKVIIGALLHDIIEDTESTPEEIESLFGEEMLALVMEVSDDKNLPKDQRKRLQIEHAPHLSPAAKLIKVADKICNVRDITHSPPHAWSLKRRKEYLEWTEKVLNGLRGCNTRLEAFYDEVLREARVLEKKIKKIEMTPEE